MIALRGTGKTENIYTVSTFVTSQIAVNAAQSFQYRLVDANGRIHATGNGVQGFNRIDLTGKASGMYILQLYNSLGVQSERIIKQ